MNSRNSKEENKQKTKRLSKYLPISRMSFSHLDNNNVSDKLTNQVSFFHMEQGLIAALSKRDQIHS